MINEKKTFLVVELISLWNFIYFLYMYIVYVPIYNLNMNWLNLHRKSSFSTDILTPTNLQLLETSLISLYWNIPENRFRISYDIVNWCKTFTFDTRFCTAWLHYVCMYLLRIDRHGEIESIFLSVKNCSTAKDVWHEALYGAKPDYFPTVFDE